MKKAYIAVLCVLGVLLLVEIAVAVWLGIELWQLRTNGFVNLAPHLGIP